MNVTVSIYCLKSRLYCADLGIPILNFQSFMYVPTLFTNSGRTLSCEKWVNKQTHKMEFTKIVVRYYVRTYFITFSPRNGKIWFSNKRFVSESSNIWRLPRRFGRRHKVLQRRPPVRHVRKKMEKTGNFRNSAQSSFRLLVRKKQLCT